MRYAFSCAGLSYSKEQYLSHIDYLKRLEKKYPNLTLTFSQTITSSTVVYVKEDQGVIMAKTDGAMLCFVIEDKNMTNAFWDCIAKRLLF